MNHLRVYCAEVWKTAKFDIRHIADNPSSDRMLSEAVCKLMQWREANAWHLTCEDAEERQLQAYSLKVTCRGRTIMS